jgi:5-methylcytosine-specific restriction endonuclease McrA
VAKIKQYPWQKNRRKRKPNHVRFPYRKDDQGRPLCRMCGTPLTGRRRSFCGPRCVRDFFMQTDWGRVREVVYVRDGGRCMKCGKKVRKDDYHVDHIHPISKGGDHWDLFNLECSCPTCNLKKGAKIDD